MTRNLPSIFRTCGICKNVSVSLADLTMRKVQIIESKLFSSVLGEMNILTVNCVLYVKGVVLVRSTFN